MTPAVTIARMSSGGEEEKGKKQPEGAADKPKEEKGETEVKAKAKVKVKVKVKVKAKGGDELKAAAAAKAKAAAAAKAKAKKASEGGGDGEEEGEKAEKVKAKVEPRCISKVEVMSSPDCIEFGRIFDPLGLSKLGSDETLAWFRHAEVKHGRVAMAAFTGWWVVAAGYTFPGFLTRDGLEFSSIPKAGLEAWDATPGIGKVQMLLFCGLVEWTDEYMSSKKGMHYLRGGVPGKNYCPGLYDPFGISASRSEKDLARGRNVEIKNGRAAMIGFIGLYAAATIQGSVPLVPTA